MSVITEYRTAPGMVARDRAVERCVESDATVLVLEAPAGYGKTTVLSQWEAADPRPFRWIGADWRHNDPAFLLISLLDELGAIEALPEDVAAPLLAPPPNIDLVAGRLCDALAGLELRFVLVLDDLHQITDADSVRLLGRVLDAVPSGSAVAAATRFEPDLPLARLRAGRRLLELRPEDLAMSAPEAGQLVERAGLALGAEQVERLVEHTEGWAAGLYLATLSLADADDLAAGIEGFYGDERRVADYLREEFLAGLSAADLGFLTRTSILDRLNGPLCDAVLGQGGSAATLRRLAHSNLLLIPLDEPGHEYRYHALLREMLESELRRLDEAEEHQLHARASRWYASAEDFDHAVLHAIGSGDREWAGSLIWSLTAEYESSGRGATLRRWLAEFSEREVRRSASLCLTSAAGAATLGDGARVEKWTTAALTALDRGDAPDPGELRTVATLIRAAGSAREGVVRMIEDMRAAKPLIPADSPWLALCCMLEGVALHLSGDADAAVGPLEEGARYGGVAAPNIECLSRAQLALLALDEGDPAAAGHSALRAIEIIDRFGLEKDPTQALSFATAALMHARGERTEVAADEARVAAELIDACNEFSPWFEAETRIVLARALLLLDDVASARAMLGDAGRHMRRTPDAEGLRRWLLRAWEDVDAAQAVTGRWPLTPAELRLLHLLPTHLSFREIAEELFVSTNTIKTQARSIYRKLGVSSRAEAVSCAAAAGLLGVDEGRKPE